MNLKRLKKLQLSECGLINVPSFSNIPNLEELNIDYGNISEVR
jgi:Leucine-rich repeat (LRR) protein